MKEIVTSPHAAVRQLSARDPEGELILSVLVKRTYHVDARGRLSRAPEQIALFDELVVDPVNPALVVHDTDLVPYKPVTDVVVLGHAHSRQPVRSLDTSVRVGKHCRQVVVLGDRRVTLSSAGCLVFSEPEPFERMPLGYDRAYGGVDHVAEARLDDPAAPIKACLLREPVSLGASACSYPRNFAGKGYLIDATSEAVEALRLPNLEDPADRLTPERLAVGNTLAWPKMPLPAAYGVVDYGWFPRISYVGIVPPHDQDPPDFAEVRRGFAPASIAKDTFLAADPQVDFRFTSCASLGLALPHLAGDEEIVLCNLHPAYATWTLRLPGERPELFTDGRNGRLNETAPVLQSLTIEPDHDRITAVWRGSARAIRPYLPVELETMPLYASW